MNEREDEFVLPENIHSELRALYTPARGMNIRDAEILAAARQAGDAFRAATVRERFLAVRPQRYWRLIGAVGIAAAVALAAGLMWHQYSSVHTPVYARTGDIRDAFYLAREIKSHGGKDLQTSALEGSWDANGDGVINEKDVRLLALAAVKVKEVTP